MQLPTTALLTLLLTLTTALPTKRAAATVLTNIFTIASDVKSLTASATAYTGALLESLTLAIAVESAITTATTDTTSSATFTAAESDSVLADVSSLAPSIVTLLGIWMLRCVPSHVLVSKEGVKQIKATMIATAGYTSTVESALMTLKTDADAFFAALEAYSDVADAPSLVTLQASVDAAFATAIGIF